MALVELVDVAYDDDDDDAMIARMCQTLSDARVCTHGRLNIAVADAADGVFDRGAVTADSLEVRRVWLGAIARSVPA